MKAHELMYVYAYTGRPQIGKTGAVLHTIFKLWNCIQPTLKLPELVVVSAPHPKPDPPDLRPDPQTVNMGVYPSFDVMKVEKFAHPPGPGKYGDPGNSELRAHYIEQYLHVIHPAASTSTVGAASDCATSLPAAAMPIDMDTTVGTSTTRFASKSFGHSACDDLVWNVPVEVGGGRLHMTADSHECWWNVQSGRLKTHKESKVMHAHINPSLEFCTVLCAAICTISIDARFQQEHYLNDPFPNLHALHWVC